MKAHESKNQGLFNNAAQSWNHAFYWECMKVSCLCMCAALVGTAWLRRVGVRVAARVRWNCFGCAQSGGGGKPSGKLAEMIDRDFGSFDDFKKEFAVAGNTAFGSGWAWLNYDGKKLSVTKTIGAGNPITDGLTPVLTMDVWEHAYYLNYQNLRAKYVDTFMDSLVNWDFVAANLEKAM